MGLSRVVPARESPIKLSVLSAVLAGFDGFDAVSDISDVGVKNL